MHSLLRGLTALTALGASGLAHASWQRASTAHFVIYANESPSDLLAFATKLERFDKAVRYVRAMEEPQIGDGNRLTVFVVPGVGAVQKLAGDRTGNVYGYYSGRATGSIAVVPRSAGSGEPWELSADAVFFHEYAHHMMFANFQTPLPEWFIEGFAEFFSTAQINKDGSVGLGIPPLFRAYGLIEGSIDIERLLSGNFAKMDEMQRESAYGRSWLLTHYINFNPERSEQLNIYVQLLAKGTKSVEAAREAFGDLKKLDRALDGYLLQSKIKYLKLGKMEVKSASIEIQPLSPGGAAVMMDRIRSKAGVNAKTAEPLAARVRAIAKIYPGDLLVERTLAEAELDAGHADASLAAADRALKADPRDVEALIFKGRAMASGDAADRFATARKYFLAANAVDHEDPEPLMYFYQAFVMQGIRPTANAVAALHYASDLAPQDLGLRLISARQFLIDGKAREARQALVPVAYDPHGEAVTAIARAVVERIDAGDSGAALKLVEAKVAEPDDKSKK